MLFKPSYQTTKTSKHGYTDLWAWASSEPFYKSLCQLDPSQISNWRTKSGGKKNLNKKLERLPVLRILHSVNMSYRKDCSGVCENIFVVEC